MLLERFGLWDARHERAGSFSRGMLQRLALCRALLHEPGPAPARRAVHRARRGRRRRCSTASSPSCRRARTVVLSTHDPARVGRSRRARLALRMTLLRRRRGARAEGPAARAARARHPAGDAPLRRLDARRLPLRAAGGRRRRRRAGAPLGRARLHRAPRARRAFVAGARAAALLDGLVLAPCDRSAIWLGEGARRCSSSSCCAELVALPAFALFFAAVDAAPSPASRSPTSASARSARSSAAMAAASRTRELLLPLLFLPLAIPLVVGGVGASVAAEPGRFLAFLGALRRDLRDPLLGVL